MTQIKGPNNYVNKQQRQQIIKVKNDKKTFDKNGYKTRLLIFKKEGNNMNINEFNDIFGSLLDKYLRKKIKEYKNILEDSETISCIEHVYTILSSRKNKIAAYSFVTGYLFNQKELPEQIINISMAFELIHLIQNSYEEIHTNMKSRAETMTLAGFISEQDEEKKDKGSLKATVITNTLLSWVYEIFSIDYDILSSQRQDFFNASNAILNNINKHILIMSSGKNRTRTGFEDIKKYSYQLAEGFITGPILAGAALSGANPKQKQLIVSICQKLGFIYQIAENVNDIKRTTFNNIQSGQESILSYFIENKSSNYDKTLMAMCVGKDLNSGQKMMLKKMFEESGAIDYSNRKKDEYKDQIKKELEKLKVSTFSIPEQFEVYIDDILSVS